MSVKAYDIYQELIALPENKLAEVKRFVEFIKFEKQNKSKTEYDIKKFAGAWSSMDDEQFAQFEAEWQARRKAAFSKIET